MQFLNSFFKTNAPLFSGEGKLIEKRKNHLVMNSILIILRAKRSIDSTGMQYELLHCGVYIEIPELKQAMEYLQKNGFSIIQTPKGRMHNGQKVK